jgi:hypothetical protein
MFFLLKSFLKSNIHQKFYQIHPSKHNEKKNDATKYSAVVIWSNLKYILKNPALLDYHVNP